MSGSVCSFGLYRTEGRAITPIFGTNFIGHFAHFYFIGITAIYAIFYGVRALRYGARFPGNPGSAMAIVGIVPASLALVNTVLGFVGL